MPDERADGNDGVQKRKSCRRVSGRVKQASERERAGSSLQWTLTKATGARDQSDNHRRDGRTDGRTDEEDILLFGIRMGGLRRWRRGEALLPYLWSLDVGRRAAPAERFKKRLGLRRV